MFGSGLRLGVGFVDPASPGWGLGWVCLGTICGVVPLLPAICGVRGQAVHEAARHLPAGDKALWLASWRSAGNTWTGVFCSGLVPEEAEAQLRAIARYDPPGGTSVDNFLHHMLQLGDFAWELRNHRLEQLLREPLSAAPRVHRWLTATEGDYPLSPPRPDKDFVASPRVVNGTLECPPQEGPQPYRDLPGGFSRHLQDAPFPPWIIGPGSMTAWEARMVGEEWAREWDRWCAATRAPETPAQRYAAIPLESGGRTPGPDPPCSAGRDLTTHGTRRRRNGCKRPRRRKQDGRGTCPHSSGRPPPPASSFTRPTYSGLRRYANGDTTWQPSDGIPRRTGRPSSPWRTSKLGGRYT